MVNTAKNLLIKLQTDVHKTSKEGVTEKRAEEIGDLIGYKIADKIT